MFQEAQRNIGSIAAQHVNTEAPANGAVARNIQILRMPQLTKKTGASRSSIYDWLNPKSPRFDPTFPVPVKLSGASIGWIEAEVDAWLASRPRTRTA
jgi:prophage regulatory protein